jgi:hypothetical protein
MFVVFIMFAHIPTHTLVYIYIDFGGLVQIMRTRSKRQKLCKKLMADQLWMLTKVMQFWMEDARDVLTACSVSHAFRTAVRVPGALQYVHACSEQEISTLRNLHDRARARGEYWIHAEYSVPIRDFKSWAEQECLDFVALAHEIRLVEGVEEAIEREKRAAKKPVTKLQKYLQARKTIRCGMQTGGRR